jgi:predicted DNA-binding antitoxin AbrB/MazE fold protein
MTRIAEAIYSNGVLKPATDLELREHQRVRIIVEPLDDRSQSREAALARLGAGIESMHFRSNGRLPTRDDLHDRD